MDLAIVSPCTLGPKCMCSCEPLCAVLWLTEVLVQVVYLTDVIDEPVFNHLEKFDEKALIDVAREGLDLGETEDDKQQVWHTPRPQYAVEPDCVYSTTASTTCSA